MNKEALLIKTARAQLLVKKHSPELLLAGGIVGIVGGTVLACKATLKAPAIVSGAKAMLNAIDLIADTDTEEEHSESEVQKAKLITTLQFGFELGRLYVPTIVVLGVSIAMLVGSNRILSRRNVALIGAYKAVDEAFKRYRGRVRDELGDDVDIYFRYKKPRKGGIQVLDDKKKSIKFEEEDNVDLPGELHDGEEQMGMPSPYAIFFDADSVQWRTDCSYNEFFLKAQQNYANQLLQTRGHVFLNEVYDGLGVERSKAGAVVGWVKDHGDNFIDFDIYNPFNAPYGEIEPGPATKQMLLDFNVDGIIFDII
jgi:hypothetical protein